MHQTRGCWLHCHGGSMRCPDKCQFAEWSVKVDLFIGHSEHFVAEILESQIQLFAHFTFHLSKMNCQIINNEVISSIKPVHFECRPGLACDDICPNRWLFRQLPCRIAHPCISFCPREQDSKRKFID